MAVALAGLGVGLAGGIAAYNSAPSGFNIKKYGPRTATFLPQVLAFLQAGGDLSSLLARKVPKRGADKGGTPIGQKIAGVDIAGIDPAAGAYLSGAFGDEKETGQYKKGFYLEDGTRVRKTDTIKFGKNRVLVGGDFARGLMEKQFEIAQQKQIDQTQKNYDLLFGPNGPQVLKELISDRPERIREALGPSASRLLQGAIGGAAPRGTLTTDAVLQRASAPVAFQFENIVQQAEDVKSAQQLGLSGVPGFGGGFGADPNNFLSPQSLPYLQNLGLQAYGQGQYNPSLANQQSRQQAQGYLSGLYGGAGGGLSQGLFGLA